MADDFRNKMDDIFRHINAGQINQAENLCHTCLQSDPEDINVLGILGAILLQKGQLALKLAIGKNQRGQAHQ